MKFNKESAVERAKADLAERLGVPQSEISVSSVVDQEFPDMLLGVPVADEMAAQMISYGWQINLEAAGETFEYRADKYQLRLYDFRGTNYEIKS